jgi:hypothetical protein
LPTPRRAFRRSGPDGSNPFSSSGESVANCRATARGTWADLSSPRSGAGRSALGPPCGRMARKVFGKERVGRSDRDAGLYWDIIASASALARAQRSKVGGRARSLSDLWRIFHPVRKRRLSRDVKQDGQLLPSAGDPSSPAVMSHHDSSLTRQDQRRPGACASSRPTNRPRSSPAAQACSPPPQSRCLLWHKRAPGRAPSQLHPCSDLACSLRR